VINRNGAEPLLKVENLSVEYHGRRGQRFRAVNDVSFAIGRGETLGLVGESGSGKSTIGKAVLGLVPVAAGRIMYDGEDITRCRRRRRRELTRHIQVVFQDPYGSLNPVRTIGSTMAEALTVHEPGLTTSQVTSRVGETLEQVGVSPDVRTRLPAEFSGGQRQRIAIARALILLPRLVICDEAVSSLDLSVQAQVLNLLEEFRQRLGISYLFISHDLAVVRHMASRVAVLYRGELVELDATEEVWRHPTHPYTAMLQAAAPVPDPQLQRVRRIEFEKRYLALVGGAPDPVSGTIPAGTSVKHGENLENKLYSREHSSILTVEDEEGTLCG
jgi:ABC-type oligopeptide transport system ATPase subunit